MSLKTFDFDDTLAMQDNSLNPIGEKHFRKCMENKDMIFIVTSRHFSPDSEKEILKFLKNNGLHALSVIFTEGNLKVRDLMIMGSTVHFDDDKRELEALEGTGIQGVNCFNNDLFVKLWKEEFGEEPDEGFDTL